MRSVLSISTNWPFRALLLTGACGLAWSISPVFSEAQAASGTSSVEVNLDALRGLEAPKPAPAPLPAPVKPVTMAVQPAPAVPRLEIPVAKPAPATASVPAVAALPAPQAVPMPVAAPVVVVPAPKPTSRPAVAAGNPVAPLAPLDVRALEASPPKPAATSPVVPAQKPALQPIPALAPLPVTKAEPTARSVPQLAPVVAMPEKSVVSPSPRAPGVAAPVAPAKAVVFAPLPAVSQSQKAATPILPHTVLERVKKDTYKEPEKTGTIKDTTLIRNPLAEKQLPAVKAGTSPAPLAAVPKKPVPDLLKQVEIPVVTSPPQAPVSASDSVPVVAPPPAPEVKIPSVVKPVEPIAKPETKSVAVSPAPTKMIERVKPPSSFADFGRGEKKSEEKKEKEPSPVAKPPEKKPEPVPEKLPPAELPPPPAAVQAVEKPIEKPVERPPIVLPRSEIAPVPKLPVELESPLPKPPSKPEPKPAELVKLPEKQAEEKKAEEKKEPVVPPPLPVLPPIGSEKPTEKPTEKPVEKSSGDSVELKKISVVEKPQASDVASELRAQVKSEPLPKLAVAPKPEPVDVSKVLKEQAKVEQLPKIPTPPSPAPEAKVDVSKTLRAEAGKELPQIPAPAPLPVPVVSAKQATMPLPALPVVAPPISAPMVLPEQKVEPLPKIAAPVKPAIDVAKELKQRPVQDMQLAEEKHVLALKKPELDENGAPIRPTLPSLTPIVGDTSTNVGQPGDIVAAPLASEETSTPPAVASALPKLPLADAMVAEVTPAPLANNTKKEATEEALEGQITFKKGQSVLTKEAQKKIAAIAAKVKQEGHTVRVVGYAAGTAEEASIARKISLARALAIRAALINTGIAQAKVNAQAFGNKVAADKVEIYSRSE